MNANFLRTILTAAHCICTTPEQRSYDRENRNDPGFTTCQTRQILSNLLTPNPTNRLDQHILLEDSKGSPLESKQVWDMWDQKKTTKINPKKPFNHIDVKIGSKDFTKGILQGIKSAYVMYANDESAGNRKPDIGLIVVERKLNWEGDYPDKTVGPICLPSR